MDIKAFISSGILEQYVLGTLTEEESQEVRRMAAAHAEVREEIENISLTMERYARAHAVSPGRTVKPFLLATIDYLERMENGEPPTFPPLLNKTSQLAEFGPWLNRADMFLPADAEDLYARIIGYSPGAITAIVWIKDDAPLEVHHDEYEHFLIVEGTCNITVEDEVYELMPGDYFSIPLFKPHSVKVTSNIPCKVILQRIAA